MSKLKRKKSALEETRSVPKIKIKDGEESPSCRNDKPDCLSLPCVPDVPEEERLWTQVFCLLCPTFSAPELPPAPTAQERATVKEWHWPSLDEEVTELPILLPPVTPLSSEECVPFRDTSDVAFNRETQTPGTCQRHPEEDGRRRLGSVVALKKTAEGTDKLAREASENSECEQVWNTTIRDGRSSEGSLRSGVKTRPCNKTHGSYGEQDDVTRMTRPHEERRGKIECERKSGSGLTYEAGAHNKASTSGIESDGSRLSGSDSGANIKAGTSGGARHEPPGAELDCCPMCLMPFPAGLSQLECDGHLAQCLSEMNADIVW